jgi:hypothetical protein
MEELKKIQKLQMLSTDSKNVFCIQKKIIRIMAGTRRASCRE